MHRTKETHTLHIQIAYFPDHLLYQLNIFSNDHLQHIPALKGRTKVKIFETLGVEIIQSIHQNQRQIKSGKSIRFYCSY